MHIIIVGRQRSGKTTLAEALRGAIQKFMVNENAPSTIGVHTTNIDVWKLAAPSDLPLEYVVTPSDSYVPQPITEIPMGEFHSKEVHTPVGEVLEIKSILGSTATDKVTGFTGIVTAHCTYLTGAPQYCITGKSIDNKPADSCWFDAERVQFED